jgi:FkbM family methyltransferase
MHQSAYDHIEACVRQYLDKDKEYKVLDFGSRMSGKQHLIHRDIFRSTRSQYVGLDVKDGDNVDVVMPAPYSIPFADETMDVVVSGQVFEHVPYFWASFLEMARVLKRDGYIFLTAPSRGHVHSHPYDCWRFYPDGYRALAAFASLRLVRVHTDFPGRLPNGRLDYASVPGGQYWGDTVGVFQKNEHYKKDAIERVRGPLQAWVNQVADVSEVLKDTGSTDKSGTEGPTIVHKAFDIVIPYNTQIIPPKVSAKLNAGTYEIREATAVLEKMKSHQRVLELGGGLGFMSTLVAKRLEPAAYTLVEADPRLIPIIKETHQLNNVKGVLVHNCVATSNPELLSRGYCELQIASTFWGSSINAAHLKNAKKVRVEAVPLKTFLHSAIPDVLLVDIEGGEVDLFTEIDMPSVQLVIMELHPNVIGADGMSRIENEFARMGLHKDAYDDATRVGIYRRA